MTDAQELACNAATVGRITAGTPYEYGHTDNGNTTQRAGKSPQRQRGWYDATQPRGQRARCA